MEFIPGDLSPRVLRSPNTRAFTQKLLEWESVLDRRPGQAWEHRTDLDTASISSTNLALGLTENIIC